MAENIDISTHQLGELAYNALNGKVSLESILTIWHNIGGVVRQYLGQKKGVKMSSFGTFSLSTKNEPVFVMSSDLAAQFKLRQRAQPMMERIPIVSLNFTQLMEGTQGLTRDTVDKVYAKILTCMGRAIFEGRSLLITIHKVAEITIVKGELACNFMPDFVRIFTKQTGAKVTQNDAVQVAANRTINNVNRSSDRSRAEEYSEEPFQIGGEVLQYKGKMRGASNARGGDVNPITGERWAEKSTGSGANNAARRPASTGRMRPSQDRGEFRRPGSASAASPSSQMYSPRPGGGGGLRREQLEQHTRALSRQQQPAQGGYRAPTPPAGKSVNARQVAAKALDVGDVVNKVRTKIVERGGSNGIRSIAKLLTIMDDNGDKKLSRDELKYGLRDYGIDLTPTELEQVFLYFDRDGNGFIDTTEFLVGLRGDLTERRKKMVRMAFDILDTDRSGVISTDEILSKYDLNWHPEVRAGKKTVKEAAKDFMAQWDRKDHDGNITVEEFEDYYKEVSASIDDDTYFELMIRNAWRIAGGEGQAANTANRRVLVTNKDGSQSIQTINQELGMNAKDMNDIRGRLAKQGVDAGNIELYGGMDTTEKAKRVGGRPVAGGSGNRGAAPVATLGNRGVAPRSPAKMIRSKNNSRGYADDDLMLGGPMGGDQGGAPDDFEEPQESYRYAKDNTRREIRAPNRDAQPQRSSSANSTRYKTDPKTTAAFDTLKRVLYTPPISLEALCTKLQTSSVSNAPRIAQGAFYARMSTLDPTLDKKQLKDIWTLVDPKNVGTVDVSIIHEFLGDRYGKDKSQTKGTGVIERAIKKILERCGELAGLKGLQRALSIMDDNGDKKLTRDELKSGMADYGVELNMREVEELFNYFDRDRNGTIDVNEFFLGIKGDLNERRKKLVQLAFNNLDRDNSGVVTVEEMMEVFNFKAHPDVVAGKKSVKEAMKEFMSQWGDADGDGDIEYSEFEDYYKGVSASIDGDDYFELMIRNAWRIAGGEGQAANTANRRVLVTNKDGSQSIQTINQELGMNAKDMNDIRGRLAKQGVDAGNIELYGGMDTRDKNAKGQMPKGLGSSRTQVIQGKSRTQNFGDKQRGGGSGGGSGLNRTAPGRVEKRHDEFERHAAAAKLAAAFRGRMGRKVAEGEKRKADAERRDQREQEYEENRPKPRQILRPKGNSYIGF